MQKPGESRWAWEPTIKRPDWEHLTSIESKNHYGQGDAGRLLQWSFSRVNFLEQPRSFKPRSWLANGAPYCFWEHLCPNPSFRFKFLGVCLSDAAYLVICVPDCLVVFAVFACSFLSFWSVHLIGLLTDFCWSNWSNCHQSWRYPRPNVSPFAPHLPPQLPQLIQPIPRTPGNHTVRL